MTRHFHIGVFSSVPWPSRADAEQCAAVVARVMALPAAPVLACTDLLCEWQQVVSNAEATADFDTLYALTDDEAEAWLEERFEEKQRGVKDD